MSTNERNTGSTGASQPSSSGTRTFSADLNNAFSMDKSLDGLVQSVEQKKQAVSSQTQELEALEAKLKETEQRLKEKQSSPAAKAKANASNEQQTQPEAYTYSQGSPAHSNTQPAERPSKASSDQAPSASTMSYWRPPMPGTMPETPGDSRQNSYLGSGSNDA